MTDSQFFTEFFGGLRALAESSFPKRCTKCGRVYPSAEQFLAETKGTMSSVTGLIHTVDEDGSAIVEAYRNCVCGSTLVEFFGDRRDTSEAGLRRRERFDTLMQFLVSNGLDREVAHTELLVVVRGGRSEIIEKMRPPQIP
jgi:hypothetical protein